MTNRPILIIVLLLLSFCAQASSHQTTSAMSDSLLPVEHAFQLSVKPTNTDSIIAHWQIAPGYYLYKGRFKFIIKGPKEGKLGLISMPKGIKEKDEILGNYTIYKNNVSIAIPVLNPTKEPLQLLVKYQGCAEQGFCYPPQTKLVTITNSIPFTLTASHKIAQPDITVSDYNPASKTKAKTETNGSEQTEALSILQNSDGLIALLLFFGFGLLLAFTPCVLPMIPILSGIIVGHGKKIATGKAFCLSLAYVLGMSLSFAVAGLMIGLLGDNIQAAMQQPWVLLLFSLVFVLLALSLFGFYELKLPASWQQKVRHLSDKQHAGHYFSVALMGALSSLIVSPCVSAPLVGALAYIGNTGNALFGGAALFFMGLGMGTPLLIIGTSFGKLLPKAGRWMKTVSNFFGVVMLAVAIWMLERIIPGPLSLLLWAALFIVSAIYMGALGKIGGIGRATNSIKSNWDKLWQGVGIILLTYGVLLIIGAALGNSDLFQPLTLHQLNGRFLKTDAVKTGGASVKNQLTFIAVKTVADVENKIDSAKKVGKPVMLDFSADWCISCKELERRTFSNPKVRAVLAKFVLLRADVTANDIADRVLQKHYKIIGPPTILFFDKKGEEIKDARVIGFVNAEAFLGRLRGMS